MDRIRAEQRLRRRLDNWLDPLDDRVSVKFDEQDKIAILTLLLSLAYHQEMKPLLRSNKRTK